MCINGLFLGETGTRCQESTQWIWNPLLDFYCNISHSDDADMLWHATLWEQPETEPRVNFSLQHEPTPPTPAAANLPSLQTASPTPLITRRAKLLNPVRPCVLCGTAGKGCILSVASNELYCTEIHHSALAGLKLEYASQTTTCEVELCYQGDCLLKGQTIRTYMHVQNKKPYL